RAPLLASGGVGRHRSHATRCACRRASTLQPRRSLPITDEDVACAATRSRARSTCHWRRSEADMHIHDLLATPVKRGASDLHMKVGSFPMLRIDGTLVPATQEKRLDPVDMENMAATLLNPDQRAKYDKSQEVDVAYAVPALGRFRCNVFQQRGTIGMV